MQRIASTQDIPAGGLRFSYREGPFDEEGILLVTADGGVRAFKNQCRHLPTPLDHADPGELWDRDQRHLLCSSHGARYRPGDGLCVAGPCAGSHLKALPIVLRDGEVFLDTAKLGGFFAV
ncbi:MAG TPA: Rieske 2Fe-2S domain-containing protein [Thermoanaerobaculales bacterium]|nr:Rieske 2Fe-2S domain-containing protein [Thermoanaerobaculales bacterium]HPA79312.1 Rieske 2Fe-2S domain-containing protein [Thermoanaerobaculales bacterium]HQL31282.1 Rieske 2Fe-2S domain-containing protein [Thermoanaerobaculales bacterium]HQN96151.1 Rieske 2Fe-2S domain-containing protein [Thermoanaerobaculales bacterium]HQP42647.1 Rieske 2Fe-2S domain-containing protein [Thermoanaerobaculales bacterium]